MLIDPSSSPAAVPSIYRGGYGSGTRSTVKGWYSNWIGDAVCASGATTGELCGTVYDDGESVYFGGAWVNVIQVSVPAGSIVAGQGDSGAPVFKKVSGRVQATDCGTGNPDMDTFHCSRHANYEPVGSILSAWGASLEVG